MAKRIIEKIKINQSIVKNKNVLPIERRNAYLELKRLNSLKKSGSIIKIPDHEMFFINPKQHKPYEHNYFVFNTDEKNNVKVNKITHGKISYKKEIPSLYDYVDDKSTYIGLKIIDSYQRKDKFNKPFKFYNFYESNLNNKISKKTEKDNIKEEKIKTNYKKKYNSYYNCCRL